MGRKQIIRGRELIVNRIPLKDGGRAVGAYGRVVFKNVEQLWESARKAPHSRKSKVRYTKAN